MITLRKPRFSPLKLYASDFTKKRKKIGVHLAISRKNKNEETKMGNKAGFVQTECLWNTSSKTGFNPIFYSLWKRSRFLLLMNNNQ